MEKMENVKKKERGGMRRNLGLVSFVLIVFFILSAAAKAQIYGTEAPFRRWALTPPMGWSSWDCYYSTVNEALTMRNARYMRDHLLEYGWEYVIVDVRWYANHPSNGGGNYNQTNPDCVLDAYGRYIPSPTRFPSVMQDGVNIGFKALADSIHAMGLKFGIHIMRGLPKYILNNPSDYVLKGDCLDMANQWRMMDDLWDNWSSVKAVFNEAVAWQPYYRPGNYAVYSGTARTPACRSEAITFSLSKDAAGIKENEASKIQPRHSYDLAGRGVEAIANPGVYILNGEKRFFDERRSTQ